MRVIILCLLVACVFDYTRRRIPNMLVGFLFLWGLLWKYHLDGILGVAAYLITCISIILIFFFFFQIGGLGAGDLKLIALCCGLVPSQHLLILLFLIFFNSFILGLLFYLIRGCVKERFMYLCSYIRDIYIQRQWKLYQSNNREEKTLGIPMAGPILFSFLLINMFF